MWAGTVRVLWPSCGRSRLELGRVEQIWPLFCPCLGRFGQHLGIFPTNSARVRPNLAGCSQFVQGFHRLRGAEFGPVRPTSARFGPMLARIRPDLRGLRRSWAEFGQLCLGLGQAWPLFWPNSGELNRFWQGFGQLSPGLGADLARTRPTSSAFDRIVGPATSPTFCRL